MNSKYITAMQEFIDGLSLSKIRIKYHLDRKCFVKFLRQNGLEVINKQNLPRIDESVFDNIDTEHKAYWLGFLYADGNVSSLRNTIEVSLKPEDFSHLEKFAEFISFTGKIELNNTRCRLSFNSRKIKDKLISLGCTPKKSLLLTFPTLSQVPKELVSSFCRGYFDGDGCISPSRTGYRASVISTKEFIEEFIVILNIEANVLKDKRWKGNTYYFSVSGLKCQELLNILYYSSTIYLDRKYYLYERAILPS